MNKSRLPQPETIFFLDECMGGNKVASVMREAGHRVEIHVDHFDRGMPDENWLPVIGKSGWILTTQDKAIKRRKNELEALRENRVRAFIVAARGLRGEEIGALVVRVMPKILRVLKNTNPPLIAIITRDKVVELKEGQPRHSKK